MTPLWTDRAVRAKALESNNNFLLRPSVAFLVFYDGQILRVVRLLHVYIYSGFAGILRWLTFCYFVALC